jgi:Tol biopolymer transport system component
VQQPKQDGRTQPVCEDCGTLLGWTPDGRNIIQAAESTGAARTIGLIDAASGRKTLLLMGAGLDQAAVSPDGDRVAFTMRDSGLSTTLYTARATGSKPVPAVDWKQLTDGRSWEDKPTWSPDGSALFFFSDRDGNRCIWKQRLDRNGVTRAGPAQPVLHFHRANPSTRYLSVNAVSLSAGGSWLYYTAGTMSANLWMIKP